MAAKSAKKTKSVKTARTPRVQATARPGKPVFRAGTWAAIVVLAAVIGAALYMNRQAEIEAETTETPAAGQAFLFERDVIVTGIEIQAAGGEPVRVERNPNQPWVLSKPEDAEADQGAAEAAASQIGALGIVTEVEGQKDPSIFGFDEPFYTIDVTFEDGTTSTLEVGDMTPSESGYYVRVDGGKVYVVSPSGIDVLAGLALTPPYLNTPTPIPTATSTPLPTEASGSETETSSTPEATPKP